MTSRSRSVLVAALLGACVTTVALPRDAHADAGPKIDKGLFLPVGLNVGYSANYARERSVSNGFLFGGEASLVFFKRFIWSGAYADVLRDFGEQEWRSSVGLEAGVGPVGVDIGWLGAFRDQAEHGFRARMILTTSAISAYAGYGRTWTDGRSQAEFGLLLKVPLPIFVESQKRPEPQEAPLPTERPAPLEPPPATIPATPATPPTAPTTTPGSPIAPDATTPPPSSPAPATPPAPAP